MQTEFFRLFYKVLFNKLLQTFFYNFRHYMLFLLPFPRIDLIKYGYLYNSINIWNNIDETVKNCIHIGLFKKKMKDILIDQY